MPKTILVLGDCFEYLKRSPVRADCIWTDPPYGINYQSNRRVARQKFEHLKGDDNLAWVAAFAKLCWDNLAFNTHLYCCTRFDTYPTFFEAFRAEGFTMKRTLVWVKDNHGSGDLRGDYAPRDEWIIFAHKGRRELLGNRSDNVFFVPKIPSGRLLHPTQKPFQLVSEMLVHSVSPGELVLDPFAGSFTTNRVANILGVDSIGIEKDPIYFDLPIMSTIPASWDLELITEPPT